MAYFRHTYVNKLQLKENEDKKKMKKLNMQYCENETAIGTSSTNG